LILPTLFSLIGIGAFSLGWNLISYRRKDQEEKDKSAGGVSPWFVGIAAALALAVLGNLGSLLMIFDGFQKMGAFGMFSPDAGILNKVLWGLRGMFEYLKGTPLPYSIGEWYWNPSRVIPGSVINEFPMFTVLYADLHAHLIALPITLLSIGWTLSTLFSQGWANYRSKLAEYTHWRQRAPQLLKIAWSIALGALAVGALRPTNTWDFPTYLALGAVILAYAVGKYYRPENASSNNDRSVFGKIALGIIGSVALFVGLALLFYWPYTQTYVQGYNAILPWDGEITPLGSYFVHWGFFLVVLVSWFIWETRQWLASTPLSSLRKLKPYRYLFIFSIMVFFGVVLILQVPFQIIPQGEIGGLKKWVFGLLSHGTSITWLVLPLAAWPGILLLRPKISDAKRLVLFFVGTALILTLMVDVVIIESVGRMNTVFKFYMQAWILFALSSAAALGWILTEIKLWHYAWRSVWQLVMVLLVGSTALFPLLATAAKVRDRMSAEAPNTLDGMAYMQFATYGIDDINLKQGIQMDLSQDYHAIQWMQANIQGSPVIVEANRPQYQWGSRFTIYTGLPGVIGWSWHQFQQREFVPGNSTGERVIQIQEFYETEDENIARAFLQTYDVKYIVLGQLERATYQEIGFPKFERLEGVLWREVYRDQDTIIYEVIPETLGLSTN
jgi:YYY domain-containing protein